MLYDRQAEAGSLRGARACFVDAIKTFGKPAQMFLCDADAIIDYNQTCALVFHAPADIDTPTVWRITNSIREQIGKRAFQLIMIALEIDFLRLQSNLMLAGR